MNVQITMLKIVVGTFYFIAVLMYFTLLPSLDSIKTIESEVCSQHEGFKHCENGETIEFGGGVK